jgi:hypothetical protein
MVLLASDGVFEFLTNAQVVELIEPVGAAHGTSCTNSPLSLLAPPYAPRSTLRSSLHLTLLAPPYAPPYAPRSTVLQI